MNEKIVKDNTVLYNGSHRWSRLHGIRGKVIQKNVANTASLVKFGSFDPEWVADTALEKIEVSKFADAIAALKTERDALDKKIEDLRNESSQATNKRVQVNAAISALESI